jgi:hypothetical protein
MSVRHITKINTSHSLAQWPFKLVHTATLSHRENHCYLRKLKSPIYKSQFNFSYTYVSFKNTAQLLKHEDDIPQIPVTSAADEYIP